MKIGIDIGGSHVGIGIVKNDTILKFLRKSGLTIAEKSVILLHG